MLVGEVGGPPLSFESQTPTSLPFAVFWMILVFTVYGQGLLSGHVPYPGPPTTRMPPDEALLLPLYALPVTLLRITEALAP